MRETLSKTELKELCRVFDDIKAEEDKYLQENFKKIFVHTNVYNTAQIDGKNLLVGRKGSGKTALLLGIQEEYKEKYISSNIITLDDMPFNTLFNFFYDDYEKARSEIADMIELEKITCYAWKNAILGIVVLSVAKEIKQEDCIYKTLNKNEKNIIEDIEIYINKKIYNTNDDRISLGNNSIFVLLYLFLSSFQELIEDSFSIDTPNVSGIVAKTIADMLKKLDQEIELDLTEFAQSINKILIKINKKAFIGIDKFDDYYDKFYKEIQLKNNLGNKKEKEKNRKSFLSILLEGLILAGKDLKEREEFSSIDTVFAIPMDKFLELHLRERNALERKQVIYAQWKPKELFDFATRRIRTVLDLSEELTKKEVWNELFPTIIHNTSTKQPEDSFLYIARHSLWKPREIQMHISYLLERMQHNGGKTLSEIQIQESIKNSCREIIRQEFEEEFSIEYPGIIKILNQLEQSKISSVMKYTDVCDIINGERLSNTITSVDEIMVRLYKMGVIGVRVSKREKEYNETATVTQFKSNICYKFHFNNREINPFAPQSSIVVFHPMFIDRIEADHNEQYIINELKWDMWDVEN